MIRCGHNQAKDKCNFVHDIGCFMVSKRIKEIPTQQYTCCQYHRLHRTNHLHLCLKPELRILRVAKAFAWYHFIFIVKSFLTQTEFAFYQRKALVSIHLVFIFHF